MKQLSISLQDISFTYDKRKVLFEYFQLDLPSDQTIVLKGENGVGKSTLACLTAGILKPHAGRIIYSDGSDILTKPSQVANQLAFLRQKSVQNILGATPKEDLRLWLLSDKQAEDKIRQALAAWRIADKASSPVWELSTGELNSLALAGINFFPERYWILDEPFTGLDSEHSEQLIEALKQKRTISKGMLIISHQTEQLEAVADKIYRLLPKGKIQCSQ